MEQKRSRIIEVGFALVLLFLALPAVSANIDIIDVGTLYDGIDYYGYVDYQNIENYDLQGVISVFIDSDIVAEKMIDMPIRYVAGFRCSPIKSFEFQLNMSKGSHTIVAYVLSQNITIQCSYEYTMEGWEDEAADEEMEMEEDKEDWLICP